MQRDSDLEWLSKVESPVLRLWDRIPLPRTTYDPPRTVVDHNTPNPSSPVLTTWFPPLDTESTVTEGIECITIEVSTRRSWGEYTLLIATFTDSIPRLLRILKIYSSASPFLIYFRMIHTLRFTRLRGLRRFPLTTKIIANASLILTRICSLRLQRCPFWNSANWYPSLYGSFLTIISFFCQRRDWREPYLSPRPNTEWTSKVTSPPRPMVWSLPVLL